MIWIKQFRLLLRNLFPARMKIKDKFWSTLSFSAPSYNRH